MNKTLTNMVKQLDAIMDSMECDPKPLTEEFHAIGAARLSLIEAILLGQERTNDHSLEAGIAAIHSVVMGSK
jgi:hypothetical protein